MPSVMRAMHIVSQSYSPMCDGWGAIDGEVSCRGGKHVDQGTSWDCSVTDEDPSCCLGHAGILTNERVTRTLYRHEEG